MTPAPARPEGLPQALAGLERCAVMGILNVTPDSFSDGGRWASAPAAVARGLELARQGADLVDVGGESTRPGAGRVSPGEEAARVVPVVAELAAAGLAVSVDTTRAEVAAQAVAAGAVIVNDVAGGLADPEMLARVAELNAIYILGHWRTDAARMDLADRYDNVLAEVAEELAARVAAAQAAGIAPGRIVLDPGLGFSKSGQANWPLLRHLDVIGRLGYPVAIGASRKRFLGAALADGAGQARGVDGRDDATAAITALAAAAGAWCVRVHEVRANADATRIAHCWRAVPRIGDPVGNHGRHGVGGQRRRGTPRLD